jgi:cytochrome c oxidase subunit 2
MRGTVVIEKDSAFQAWLAEQPTFAQSMAQAGDDAAKELEQVVRK